MPQNGLKRPYLPFLLAFFSESQRLYPRTAQNYCFLSLLLFCSVCSYEFETSVRWIVNSTLSPSPCSVGSPADFTQGGKLPEVPVRGGHLHKTTHTNMNSCRQVKVCHYTLFLQVVKASPTCRCGSMCSWEMSCVGSERPRFSHLGSPIQMISLPRKMLHYMSVRRISPSARECHLE